MTFFLITTDHLETGLWFRDDEDFKTGMNHVATVAFQSGVCVLAFILMSNHVHFVLECAPDRAEAFIMEFKRVHSRYLSHKYGIRELLRGGHVDIQELTLGNESLERAIAYVQMNPVAANICLHATEYPWGTGRVFFQVRAGKGVAVGTMSGRACRSALHSKVVLPPDWMLGEDGYILPESYTPVRFVESLFRTPLRMNYFLTNSSKAKQALSRLEMNLPSFRDQIILAALPDLYRSMFHVGDMQGLTPAQRAEMVVQIKRRFNSDATQIARVTGIPYRDVAAMLDAF